jgi:hypothetical protein
MDKTPQVSLVSVGLERILAPGDYMVTSSGDVYIGTPVGNKHVSLGERVLYESWAETTAAGALTEKTLVETLSSGAYVEHVRTYFIKRLGDSLVSLYFDCTIATAGGPGAVQLDVNGSTVSSSGLINGAHPNQSLTLNVSSLTNDTKYVVKMLLGGAGGMTSNTVSKVLITVQ